MKKILIIFGGNSTESEISCKSAKCILENIDKDKYDVKSVFIDKNNDWFLYQKDTDINNHLITDIISFIKQFDVVFPILHGINGEDGTIQGMMDLFNIKYVGSKVLSSSCGMDKEITKIILNHHKIPIVPYLTIKDNNFDYNIIEKEIGYPLVVKPANGGSSVGVSKVDNKDQLKIAIQNANKIDKKIILEKFINGRELECAVLQKNEIITSCVGEILSANELYDYNAKYISSKSKTIVPADLDEQVVYKIQKYSKEIFEILDCRSLARIDFFYDETDDKIYLNEINTLPGFTPISMYPKLFEYSGIAIKDLITILIENA